VRCSNLEECRHGKDVCNVDELATIPASGENDAAPSSQRFPSESDPPGIQVADLFPSGSRRLSSTISREGAMLGTILLVILILLLIGAFPAWPYSRGWGYAPTGTLGLIVIIVVILVVLGRI